MVGEKYPPNVRVVSVGVPVEQLVADPENEDWPGYSIEFCGGTHVTTTGEARAFCLIGQEAVAKGVRRVTGLTGPAAEEALAAGKRLRRRLVELREVAGEALAEPVEALKREAESATLPLRDRQELQQTLAALGEKIKAHRKQQGNASEKAVVSAAQEVAEGLRVAGGAGVAEVPGADAKTLRVALEVVRQRHPEAALFLAAVSDGKVALLASVPPALVERGLKAGEWIKDVAPRVGGGGGGRPDLAQAGGKDAARLPEALEAARHFATQKLG